MIGLLDGPALALAFIDARIEFIPAPLRVLLWGALAGLLSMAIYRRYSPQQRLAALKPDLAEAQRALAAYDGPLDGVWPLMRRQFRLAFAQLGLVLGPSLLAGLPVILMWGGLALRFDTLPPVPGARVTLRLEPPPAPGLYWQPGGAAPDANGSAEIAWPSPDRPLRLVDTQRRVQLEVSATTQGLTLRPNAWDWLSAIHSTLPPDQPITALHATLPPRRFLPGLPEWLAGWETLFIAATITISLFCKRRWKIQ